MDQQIHSFTNLENNQQNIDTLMKKLYPPAVHKINLPGKGLYTAEA